MFSLSLFTKLFTGFPFCTETLLLEVDSKCCETRFSIFSSAAPAGHSVNPIAAAGSRVRVLTPGQCLVWVARDDIVDRSTLGPREQVPSLFFAVLSGSPPQLLLLLGTGFISVSKERVVFGSVVPPVRGGVRPHVKVISDTRTAVTTADSAALADFAERSPEKRYQHWLGIGP
ncbi:hypothetical protein L596_007555 [Steinernema carpocapsae]|uniref:Uncharacterized protein n=1 Tax=Steinernema carpocapsae TaxID=34508 RepID=A0A4U5P9P3_STECR|nr:hypothetical protein L596_007555 [Steinernema carpocapsae]